MARNEDTARNSSSFSLVVGVSARELLGHKNIQNTLVYTHLVNFESDDFHTAVADNAEKACKLIEAGFEYVTGEYADGGKIFRKRK